MTDWLNSNPFQPNKIVRKRRRSAFDEVDAKWIAGRLTKEQYEKLVRLDDHFDRGGQELLRYLKEIGYKPHRTLTWDDVEHVSRMIMDATGRG